MIKIFNMYTGLYSHKLGHVSIVFVPEKYATAWNPTWKIKIFLALSMVTAAFYVYKSFKAQS